MHVERQIKCLYSMQSSHILNHKLQNEIGLDDDDEP